MGISFGWLMLFRGSPSGHSVESSVSRGFWIQEVSHFSGGAELDVVGMAVAANMDGAVMNELVADLSQKKPSPADERWG
tara:strand:- start:3650 stop:3886 length:237 start_codon:yes stop_codon:yes gene_type:complete